MTRTLLVPNQKEGLQGGKEDKHEVGAPQHIHDPGIHHAPSMLR